MERFSEPVRLLVGEGVFGLLCEVFQVEVAKTTKFTIIETQDTISL